MHDRIILLGIAALLQQQVTRLLKEIARRSKKKTLDVVLERYGRIDFLDICRNAARHAIANRSVFATHALPQAEGRRKIERHDLKLGRTPTV